MRLLSPATASPSGNAYMGIKNRLSVLQALQRCAMRFGVASVLEYTGEEGTESG